MGEPLAKTTDCVGSACDGMAFASSVARGPFMTEDLKVLEVLTHAATSGQLVTVELRDGRHFSDGVVDVFSSCGTDLVIFYGRNRMYVEDITRCQTVVADVQPPGSASMRLSS
jgi:hypothetical protein